MADNKKFFWIKLRPDFFNDPYIKLLRRMAGGDTYTIIYLKMLVISAPTNGMIYFQGAGSDIAEELALVLDENIEDVRALLAYLEAKNLITHPEITQDLFLVASADLTGSEVDSAQRVRKFRERQKQKALQSNPDVTNGNDKLEKEIDIDKELEKETELDTPYRRLVAVYEENGFGTISSITSQKLNDELKDFTEKNNDVNESVEVIKKAFEIAVLNGANNLNYVLSITKRWYQSNLFTLKDIEAAELKRSNQKSQRSSKSGYKREGITPKFMQQDKATPVPEPTVDNEDLPEWMQDL